MELAARPAADLDLTSARYLCASARPTWGGRLSAGRTGGAVHAVESHRSPDELTGEPEIAVCGAIVAVGEHRWPGPAAEVACTECASVTGIAC